MTPSDATSLRHSDAHLVVDDLEAPGLSDHDEHHLIRVLRLADGASVSVTDGQGRWRWCQLADGELEAAGPVHQLESPIAPLTIGVAIPKQDRPEWIVQKLTELGVDTIAFLHADRSVVKWDDRRAAKHLARLHKVAVEAVQQSRRVTVPAIVGPQPAIGFVANAAVCDPDGVPDDAQASTVAIGPEGGWSDRELASAQSVIRLGPTVLRVETAALTAAAVRCGR